MILSLKSRQLSRGKQLLNIKEALEKETMVNSIGRLG